MPPSIRSILGKPRITKRTASPRKAARGPAPDDLFPDRFPDLGTAPLTDAEELSLRDVVQAMRYVRRRMFSAVPAGMSSTRTAELLNYRASVAPVVSTGHVRALLGGMAPSRVEREMGDLVGRGVLRRVRVEKRGEGVLEMEDMEGLLDGRTGEATKRAFVRVLRGRPTEQSVREGEGELDTAMLDELVRAGFLTRMNGVVPGSTLHVRPEDRTTLTSIAHVAQFASGTVSAVGGQNAIHLAGGGGGADTGRRRRRGGRGRGDEGDGVYRIAVPGHGRCLKLADDAVAWVRDALSKTKWGEGPESWLRERFEGNGLYGTRWKDFWGVEWEWVLGEAVGMGAVEVFDTGSVGKGVRAVGATW